MTALAHGPQSCEVVACVVTDGDRTCLVRRSRLVASDPGLWHCVTGYLDRSLSPRVCVLRELEEELSLYPVDIERLDQGPDLVYEEGSTTWVVHTFLAVTLRRRFVLNWENEEYRWTDDPADQSRSVWWLRDVYAAVESRRNLTSPTARISSPTLGPPPPPGRD
jgi:8-oxo-dGTP pyrophosphatase MutT (NUDIX family)